MGLIAFYILKRDCGKTYVVHKTQHLSNFNFWERYFIKDNLDIAIKLVTERLDMDSCIFLTHPKLEGYKIFAKINKNNLAIVVVFNDQYPKEVIPMIAITIEKEFNKVCDYGCFLKLVDDKQIQIPVLEQQIKKWQDPKQADTLYKIKKELLETDTIMQKNIDDILKRGEKIDELLIQCQNMKRSSFNFYVKTKKMNKRCCSIF